jgi:serine/threonine-protein kinase haspin
MRGQLYTGNPLDPEKPASISGIWAEYTPRTNLIWLLFVLKNLLKHMRTSETSSVSQNPPRHPLAPCPSKGNMQPTAKTEKKEAIDPYSEAGKNNKTQQQYEYQDEKKIHAALASFQQKLSDRLHKVLELLDLEHGREDMCCAADLVAYAIDQQWLDEKHFFLS